MKLHSLGRAAVKKFMKMLSTRKPIEPRISYIQRLKQAGVYIISRRRLHQQLRKQRAPFTGVSRCEHQGI